MLEATRKKFLIAHCVVFFVIILLYSVSVYVAVAHNLYEEERHDLVTLTETILSEIDRSSPSAVSDDLPDVFEKDHETPEGLSLEWYDAKKQLKASTGPFKLTTPLNTGIDYEEQRQPHALLLTRVISVNGAPQAYLRTGMNMEPIDSYENNLLSGLAIASIGALACAWLGTVYLTKMAMQPMQESMQKLSQFTSDASHELRSPLMAIKTNASVALRHKDGIRESDEQKFRVIENATNQMIKLTGDLLMLAQNERRPTSSDASELNSAKPSSVIKQVLDLLEPTIAQKSLTVNCPMTDTAEVKVSADDLYCILKNIIENAVVYSNEHGVIDISCSNETELVKVSVQDNGIGLSEEELGKVFDRFWRADKARNHAAGGNGLGLSIVRSLVDRYRGTIQLSNRRDGVLAVVTLPSAER